MTEEVCNGVRFSFIRKVWYSYLVVNRSETSVKIDRNVIHYLVIMTQVMYGLLLHRHRNRHSFAEVVFLLNIIVYNTSRHILLKDNDF